MKTKLTQALRRMGDQSGFTLIELLATMGILAVLAGMVAPAVTGTKEASVDAETLSTATQVRTSATDYFKDQKEAEIRTPHTVTTSAKVGDAVATDAQQIISSRWPEQFITNGATPPSDGLYSAVIATTAGAVNVDTVTLVDKDDAAVTGATLLTKYTAIDLSALTTGGYLAKAPNSASDVSGTGISNFLWLFKKVDSSATSLEDDRAVVVFKLTKVEQIEGVDTGTGTGNDVKLTYQQIF